ncbi:hypothetical protein PV387_03580 [Streptomyces sp. ME02-6987-2C]|uniref:hypothetical protein n=1 Tax=unclassified Streptomyces TaxID=2593676 RepID=UPI0029B5BC86|nr:MULTISPECIES: hypothetical protein [unclassified Streptomyces]MDX3345922.1 hypothetical protein [Streptomyces sp. ME02-6979A]MDX3365116.1 hypothetical protein [Streptomyces sp. ME02-6987-2C]MDX3404828.1 hypothetical protein [Streptomyces sp. ME02-6977A]MDX3421688.1 hypothetical protein [Streptomyces sp. ME02-6985-2c]
MSHDMIASRVSLDGILGPFDCRLDPRNRWNGWMSPYFTLDVARQLSAQTIRDAEECGYECMDTIHVIDGRTDSRDTVHLIDSDIKRRTDDEDTDGQPLSIAVRINWRDLDRLGAEEATTISIASRAARKAARRRKPNGKGAARTVVVHIRWQWVEESDTAADVITPNRDGLYGIGGWEWTWSTVSWWCPRCGSHADWHDAQCLCGLDRPATPPRRRCLDHRTHPPRPGPARHVGADRPHPPRHRLRGRRRGGDRHGRRHRPVRHRDPRPR